jgi:transcriptional regulator with PAS, ATPase and Fis domain
MEAEVSTLKEAVVVFEKRIIVETLARVNGSRKLAAAKLGIHRNTLLAKLGENTNKKQQ